MKEVVIAVLVVATTVVFLLLLGRKKKDKDTKKVRVSRALPRINNPDQISIDINSYGGGWTPEQMYAQGVCKNVNAGSPEVNCVLQADAKYYGNFGDDMDTNMEIWCCCGTPTGSGVDLSGVPDGPSGLRPYCYM